MASSVDTDKTVTERELGYVAAHVPPKESMPLLRELGLPDATIEQVFHDVEKAGFGIREQVYQGLLKCKETKGSAFTSGRLENALRNIGNVELAEKLKAEVLDLPPGDSKGLKGKEIEGSSFTLGELVNALRNIGNKDLAENLKAEMLDLPPGDSKGLVKITVESEMTKSNVITTFFASEEEAKSIQSDIQKWLRKKGEKKRGGPVAVLKKISDKIKK